MGVAGKHIGGNFKRHACKPKASSLGRKITGFDINVFQNYKKKKKHPKGYFTARDPEISLKT